MLLTTTFFHHLVQRALARMVLERIRAFEILVTHAPAWRIYLIGGLLTSRWDNSGFLVRMRIQISCLPIYHNLRARDTLHERYRATAGSEADRLYNTARQSCLTSRLLSTPPSMTALRKLEKHSSVAAGGARRQLLFRAVLARRVD